MRKLNLKEIQQIELNILIFFADVCAKNNLRYGLTSGTLLGAVRHGGFIPWDDDIDVVMPRPDYLKLINIMNSENGEYILKSPYNDSEYIYEYAKLMDARTVLIEEPGNLAIKMSVYIDIFPVDGVPTTVDKQLKQFKKVKKMQTLYAAIVRSRYKIKYTTGLTRTIWMVMSIFNKIKLDRVIFRALEHISMKYKFDQSSYCAVLTGQGMKEVFSKEEYDLKGKVVFEGKKFCTYTNPESYLEQFFGDYKKLPPMEQRHGHNNEVWMV